MNLPIPLNLSNSPINLTLLPISVEELKALIVDTVRSCLSAPPAEQSQLAFLSLKQAMARYGCKASLLHRLSSDRAVTTRKIGRNLHFDAAELESYFNSKIKKSSQAIGKALDETGVFPTLSRKPRKDSS